MPWASMWLWLSLAVPCVIALGTLSVPWSHVRDVLMDILTSVPLGKRLLSQTCVDGHRIWTERASGLGMSNWFIIIGQDWFTFGKARTSLVNWFWMKNIGRTGILSTRALLSCDRICLCCLASSAGRDPTWWPVHDLNRRLVSSSLTHRTGVM